MYVAVKGGENAILNAHAWLAAQRRGDISLPGISVEQIAGQLPLAVARVMAEGSLYDPQLAALAIKQASGDLIEAIFLLRAYRNTLTRLGVSRPLDTSKMFCWRRISATHKDVPGGQILGPTYDYTHRLLDFSLLSEPEEPEETFFLENHFVKSVEPTNQGVMDFLTRDGLIEPELPEDDRPGADLTVEPLQIPASRSLRLQNLSRGDEGFLLGLAYSTQRGFGNTHPFVGEIRVGEVAVEIEPEELGFPIQLGEITITECQMINQFKGSETLLPCFSRGYGLTFGHCERKAMAMALLDRSLRCRELGESITSPAQDEEFVLMHNDNVQASGFVEHLKLPHYVDFQAELALLRKIRSHSREEHTRKVKE